MLPLNNAASNKPLTVKEGNSVLKLFRPKEHLQLEHAELYALYELAYTTVDFSAAILFIIGSFLFFSEATTYVGTWMFVVGSVCFGLKPTIRLAREIHLWRLGSYQALAKRAEE